MNNDPNNHPLNMLGTIYKGGIIVPIIQTLLLTVLALSIERYFALRSAFGKGSLSKFVANIKDALAAGDMKKAQEICDKQRGSVANVVTSTLRKYEEMEKNNIRFQAKYKQIEENEVRFEEIHCDDADYLIVAFGSMARIGQKAMELAREEGIKVGMLRPITLWPFPTKAIAAYADKVKGMLVTELNAGQMVEDVRLAVNGKVKVEHFGRLGGIVPDPDEIVDALKEKLIKK